MCVVCRQLGTQPWQTFWEDDHDHVKKGPGVAQRKESWIRHEVKQPTAVIKIGTGNQPVMWLWYAVLLFNGNQQRCSALDQLNKVTSYYVPLPTVHTNAVSDAQSWPPAQMLL